MKLKRKNSFLSCNLWISVAKCKCSSQFRRYEHIAERVFKPKLNNRLNNSTFGMCLKPKPNGYVAFFKDMDNKLCAPKFFILGLLCNIYACIEHFGVF